MSQRPTARRLVVLLGGLIIGGAALGLSSALMASRLAVTPAVTAAIGWMIGVAWVSAGALMLLLLSRDDVPDPTPSVGIERCRACGMAIAADWRLCPHCGTLIEDEFVTGVGDTSGALL